MILKKAVFRPRFDVLKVFVTALLFLSFKSQAQIVRIENDQAVSEEEKLSGSLDLNFYSVRNNAQFFRLATGSEVKYTKNKSTVLSINELRLLFNRQNSLENRGFQHFRFQRSLDSTITLEMFSQFQFDQILKIRFRHLNGVGPRFQFFRQTKSRVFLGIHYMFEFEEEYETGIVNRDNRLSAHFVFSRKMEKSALHSVTYFQPNIGDFRDLRVSGSVTYSVELDKQLRFNIRGELMYDSRPVQGVNNLTYTFLNGFGWVF